MTVFSIMRIFRFFLIALLFAAHAVAGDLRFQPPSSPLNFGDFSANDDIFGNIGRGDPELLTVSLTPESGTIAAGTPFRLILALSHHGDGYTYWTNPGGPGVGTRVKWTLPEGFTVSEPEWPTPERYANGGMNFYIYKGKASLVYTVTPPAELRPGEKLTFKGEVDAQVCTPRSCVPTRLPVEAEVLAAEVPGAVSPVAKSAVAALPGEARGWRFEAADADGALVIALRPLDGANPEPGEIHFFDSRSNPFVDSQLAQRLEQAEGALWLRLPRLPGPARAGENLIGHIRAENGWLAGGENPGSFRIDLPVAAEGEGLPPGLQPAVERRVWALFAFAFLGGLLLNVMPCVFPVIGLKIMGFAKQAHRERRTVFLHGLAYTGGVLLCFWALALVVITMGRGWGAQLQSEWFLFALCHIFLIMSMNMAGVFEVGAGVAGAGTRAWPRERG